MHLSVSNVHDTKLKCVRVGKYLKGASASQQETQSIMAATPGHIKELVSGITIVVQLKNLQRTGARTVTTSNRCCFTIL